MRISNYERTYFVYMVTNKHHTTLYIGTTGHLFGRILQHRSRLIESFTSRYHLTKLVYYEEFETPIEAITREKQLKNWHRQWKWNLIKQHNPELKDLSADWFDDNKQDPKTSSG